MNSTNQPIYFNQSAAKSIFSSKTFWGAVLAGVASLVPVAIKDIKEGKITFEDTGQVILILCGVGTAIVGRVDAQVPTYTPNALPGPNKSDFEK